MCSADIEFTGNDSKPDFERIISYVTMALQFLPILILVALIIFCGKNLKEDIFENFAIVTCIDAATSITVVYYKAGKNKLLLLLLNCIIFAIGLILYTLLVMNAVTSYLGLYYLIIVLGTIGYIWYKVRYVIRG